MAERKETYIGNSKLKGSPEKSLKVILGEQVVKTKNIADGAVTKGKLGDKSVEWKNISEDVQNIIASREEGGVALSGEFGGSEMIGINQKKLTEVIGPEGTLQENISTEAQRAEDAEEALSDRVSDLEATVGEGGSVDERIEAAKSELVDGASEEGDTFKKIEDRLSDVEESVGEGGSVDERIAEEGARHYTKEETYAKGETYSKVELNNLITTPNQQYVTVDNYSALPVTGSADTIYRVSNWDGTQVDATKYVEYAWDGNSYIFLCAKTAIEEVFDISAFNSGKTYENLSDALEDVPSTRKKGGMNVKYIHFTPATYTVVKTEGVETQPTGTEVQEALSLNNGTYTAAQMPGIIPPESGSVTYYLVVTETVDEQEVTTYTTWVITKATSDVQKYVQYRLMATAWSDDVSDWQGVDDELVYNSKNLVENQAIAKHFYSEYTKLSSESLRNYVLGSIKWGKKISQATRVYTVKKGDIIKITAKEARASLFALVERVPENADIVVNTTPLDFIDGLNASIGVTANTFREYTVPVDCWLLVRYYDVNGANYFPLSVEVKHPYQVIDNISDEPASHKIPTEKAVVEYAVSKETFDEEITFYSGEKVSDTSIAEELSENEEGLVKGKQVYNVNHDLTVNINAVNNELLSYKSDNDTILKVQTEIPELSSIVKGTLFKTRIDAINTCLANQEYFYVESGKINCYHADDITIRIAEYDRDKNYIKQTDYDDISSLVLDVNTRFVRIGANYSQRGYSDANPISVEDYIEGDFGILYKASHFLDDVKHNIGDSGDIISLNEPLLLKQKLNVFTANKSLFTLLHFSDIHKDTDSLTRIVEFRDYYNNYITDSIHTGDTPVNTFGTGGLAAWFAENGGDNILLTTGNHDTKATLGDGYSEVDRETLYNDLIAPNMNQWNITHEGTNLYYYKDYSDYGIRLIVLDPFYERPAQNTWLQTVLADALTNDLSVIIAEHNPFEKITPIDCSFSDLYYLKFGHTIKTNGYGWMLRDFITSVDNFQNNGGKLICWIAGHLHRDIMHKHTDYPNQLMIQVNCAKHNTEGGAAFRLAGTKYQDCFNLYSVDTTNKLITILRIGYDIDQYMRHKGSMCINYETKEVLWND